MSQDLPHVDTITVDVAAPPPRVWEVLRPWAGSVGVPPRLRWAGRLVWGLDPPSGFALTGEVPGESVELTGRHRFARYRLVFTVAPSGSSSRLGAETYAVFPGVLGAAYRLLVIRSGAHLLVNRAVLRRVARRAEG